jgi:hypothetical protein
MHVTFKIVVNRVRGLPYRKTFGFCLPQYSILEGQIGKSKAATS